MREIMVHAETGEEALADGAAALGVDLAAVQVEIVESDPHGVTARVYVVDESAAQGPVGRERGGAEPQSDHGVLAREHLSEVLRLMGVEAVVEVVEESEEEVVLNIDGDDLGVVIGNFGQTLNALQFLTSLMVCKQGRRRITVDAGGYRQRRRVKLEEIAREHARRAKEEHRRVIIEGLRAAERRIIHTVLQNDPDVVTFSEGEEPHRRLVIAPRTPSNG